jgi:hypothetical protein
VVGELADTWKLLLVCWQTAGRRRLAEALSRLSITSLIVVESRQPVPIRQPASPDVADSTRRAAAHGYHAVPVAKVLG